MIITPERLAEIEAAPREACLFKAEAKELADAYRERDAMLRKPAQPAEPVATSYADYRQRIGAPLTFFTSVAAQAYRAAATRDDVTHEDAMRVALQAVQGAAPPAPVPPDPAAEMDAVAIRYAHKMALDLECILAEYGGSWYNTAMQTLGEYRSEMNAIHERECPTFMGEPVIAAAGDKP